MCVFVNQKANGKTLRRSTIIDVGDVRDAAAYGEADYDWCGGLIEVACY
jgi:hypothetical protein